MSILPSLEGGGPEARGLLAAIAYDIAGRLVWISAIEGLDDFISIFCSVADPGSGAFLTPGSGIGFFRILDPRPIFLRA